jgi:hypothetical protein
MPLSKRCYNLGQRLLILRSFFRGPWPFVGPLLAAFVGVSLLVARVRTLVRPDRSRMSAMDWFKIAGAAALFVLFLHACDVSGVGIPRRP